MIAHRLPLQGPCFRFPDTVSCMAYNHKVVELREMLGGKMSGELENLLNEHAALEGTALPSQLARSRSRRAGAGVRTGGRSARDLFASHPSRARLKGRVDWTLTAGRPESAVCTTG